MAAATGWTPVVHRIADVDHYVDHSTHTALAWFYLFYDAIGAPVEVRLA